MAEHMVVLAIVQRHVLYFVYHNFCSFILIITEKNNQHTVVLNEILFTFSIFSLLILANDKQFMNASYAVTINMSLLISFYPSCRHQGSLQPVKICVKGKQNIAARGEPEEGSFCREVCHTLTYLVRLSNKLC